MRKNYKILILATAIVYLVKYLWHVYAIGGAGQALSAGISWGDTSWKIK